jgi:hypothetical protein
MGQSTIYIIYIYISLTLQLEIPSIEALIEVLMGKSTIYIYINGRFSRQPHLITGGYPIFLLGAVGRTFTNFGLGLRKLAT